MVRKLCSSPEPTAALERNRQTNERSGLASDRYRTGSRQGSAKGTSAEEVIKSLVASLAGKVVI